MRMNSTLVPEVNMVVLSGSISETVIQKGGKSYSGAVGHGLGTTKMMQSVLTEYPPPPVTASYCSLDKGVGCAQHIQLPTHT